MILIVFIDTLLPCSLTICVLNDFYIELIELLGHRPTLPLRRLICFLASLDRLAGSQVLRNHICRIENQRVARRRGNLGFFILLKFWFDLVELYGSCCIRPLSLMGVSMQLATTYEQLCNFCATFLVSNIFIFNNFLMPSDLFCRTLILTFNARIPSSVVFSKQIDNNCSIFFLT